MLIGFLNTSKAQSNLPEGTKGWTYLDWRHHGLELLHAPDPMTACMNCNMPGPFYGVDHISKFIDRNFGELSTSYDCWLTFQNNFFLPPSPYLSYLDCEEGYVSRNPGVCRKINIEPPVPPSCSPSDAGFSLGNPVMVVAGAKIQRESDFQLNQADQNGILKGSRLSSKLVAIRFGTLCCRSECLVSHLDIIRTALFLDWELLRATRCPPLAKQEEVHLDIKTPFLGADFEIGQNGL